MNLPISLVIARRYAKASKDGKFVGLISLFSQAGITLGVMALIIVISVMDGFEGLLKDRILGGVPHIVITTNDDDQTIDISDIEKLVKTSMPETQAQIIQQLPLVQSTAIMQLPENFKGLLVQGLSDSNNIPLGLSNAMQTGQWSSLMDVKYGIVISRFMAYDNGLAIGDNVRLILSGASHYTPLGRLPAQRNFKIVGLFATESELDQQLVFTRSQDLNRLLKKQPQSLQGVRLVLSDPFNAKAIESELRKLMPQSNYKISSWHDTHGKLFDAVKMEKNMMWIMLSLIVAVAAFNIVSALVMMVTQKQGEVAILKTLGMNAKQIAQIFTLQGCYNGVVGALLGAILGSIVALGINKFMLVTGINLLGVPGMGLPVVYSFEKVVLIALFAIGLAFIASIYPARRAASLAPADVLRYE
ncbi:lipoprotein-releasing ABC transporter permease subunit [Psychrosphaera aestuarii]|uniref:lipoprotein-releasing ABC transporter permease subunit n=1 Tax=Psychrosphaera aestuarii TaxID=1266052 RepID=UPI001B33A294|nr:lipoprotein-releasing ABC transporter permease subunit [Psychrosphaera aestuarii]